MKSKAIDKAWKRFLHDNERLTNPATIDIINPIVFQKQLEIRLHRAFHDGWKARKEG